MKNAVDQSSVFPGKDSKEVRDVQVLQWKVLKRVLEFTERSAEGKDDTVSHFHSVETSQGFHSMFMYTHTSPATSGVSCFNL